jgi:hypothetical protein
MLFPIPPRKFQIKIIVRIRLLRHFLQRVSEFFVFFVHLIWIIFAQLYIVLESCINNKAYCRYVLASLTL